MDDIVQWPFQHRTRLTVVHPRDGSKRECEVNGEYNHKNSRRPTQLCNKGLFISGEGLDLRELINEGYVEDKLRGVWELLP